MEFQYLSFLGLYFGRSSLISLFILSLRQNSFAWPLEALLWWGSCGKVWTLVIYRRRKFFKLHWLKYPKTVPQSEIWTRKPQIMIQSLKVNKNLAKKIAHLRIQLHSKNLSHFANLDSLNIVKNILPQHSQKPYSLSKFYSDNVSGWCQKKHCTISRRTRTAFQKNLESNYVCIFMYIWRRRKLLPGGGLNNFLKAARCLGLVKYLNVFHSN